MVWRARIGVLAVVTSSVLGACGADTDEQRALFSSLPDACAVVSESRLGALLGELAPGQQASHLPDYSDYCSWTSRPDGSTTAEPGERAPGERYLSVTLLLSRTNAFGVDLAKGVFSDQRKRLGDVQALAVPIGDESFGRFSGREANVNFRRSNVTVEVSYGAGAVDESGTSAGPDGRQLRDGALAVAQEINDGLRPPRPR
ncbi:MAG: hypothetical protein ACRDTE_00460 [Pseudonocardiaceae bacterium]